MQSANHRTVAIGTTFTLLSTAPTWTFFRVKPANHYALAERFHVTSEHETSQSGTSESCRTPQLVIDHVAGGVGSPQFINRIEVPEGRCSVTYRCEVAVPDRPDPMPNDARAPKLSEFDASNWWWVQPTRYCRPDDLGAEAWDLFGDDLVNGQAASGRTVRRICTYVNEQMTFQYGSSTSFTSATDAWNRKTGVCRDFNHIAVSFCRALNIPSRYAFGYLPNIDIEPTGADLDFCAWFEVFLDNAWWTFDARVNTPRIGRIVVGRGRDATDVPMVSSMGATELTDFVVIAAEQV